MFNLLCLCCRLLFVRVALTVPIVTIPTATLRAQIIGIYHTQQNLSLVGGCVRRAGTCQKSGGGRSDPLRLKVLNRHRTHRPGQRRVRMPSLSVVLAVSISASAIRWALKGLARFAPWQA